MAKSKAIMINKIEVKVLFEVLCSLILKLRMAEKSNQKWLVLRSSFLMNTVFILSSFFQALSQPFSPGCLEKYGKRRHGRKSCVRWKWLLHMAKRKTEAPIRQKEPHGLREGKAQNGVEELLL